MNYPKRKPETPRPMSKKGDLVPLAQNILNTIMRFFRLKHSRPSFAVLMVLPPDYKSIVWTGNISGDEAVKLFRDAAASMKADQAVEGGDSPEQEKDPGQSE